MHTKINKNYNNQAFSMVELSIVLLVSAVILGILLSFATVKTEGDKIEQTKKNIEKIDKSIKARILSVNRLLCPARVDTESLLEHRIVPATSICGGDPVTGLLHEVPNGSVGVFEGLLPSASLLINEKYTYDGWGKPFSYAVVGQCIEDFLGSDCGNVNNHINIVTPIVPPNPVTDIANDAVVLILSHGRSGHGAYVRRGGVKMVSYLGAANLSKEINASLDSAGNPLNYLPIYVSANLSYNENDIDKDFDDIIYYKTKAQYMQELKFFKTGESQICDLKLLPGFASDNCGANPSCVSAINTLLNAVKCFESS